MKYEINKGTLALVPKDLESSLVYEDNDSYIINQKTFSIMEEQQTEELFP